MNARVVGVLSRFPTLSPGVAGFVIADEPTLAAALDAPLPGQGEPDELWIDDRRPGRSASSARSGAAARAERPVSRRRAGGTARRPGRPGVLGTLAAAAIAAAALALIGLLVALLGALRDPASSAISAGRESDPRRLRENSACARWSPAIGGIVAGPGSRCS